MCLNAVLNFFSLSEAEGFDERVDILFRCVTLGLSAILNGIIVCKVSELFRFVDSLSYTVNESK